MDLGINEIGEVNVAFSNADSSIDMRINSAHSMRDEEHDQDEDDSLTYQDMMSFSWQIAQGMVSAKKFVLFISRFWCNKTGSKCTRLNGVKR